MPGQPKILAFAGSARRASYNKRLIEIGAAGAREAGAVVTLVDLADYPMPLYHGDLEAEQGLPENALRLRQTFAAHDALLISAPEYNSSVTPLLKNTIDWVSRPTEREPSLKYLKGKLAGLLAASPGRLGGLRGLAHLRQILGNIGLTVIPQQLAVGGAADAFDEHGLLKDEQLQVAALDVGRRLAEMAARLLD